MGDTELSTLLATCREFNLSRDITGMLLYVEGSFTGESEGRFIQALEGDEVEIRLLFDNIRQDPRHRNITLLNEGRIKERNFKSWTMGYERKKLADYQAQEGRFDLKQSFLDPKKTGRFNSALPFLQSFYAMRKQPGQ